MSGSAGEPPAGEIPAWDLLCGLDAWQVHTVPRRPPPREPFPGEETADPLAAQRLAALTSAYHAGGPVAFGWIRESPGGPVRLLVLGQALAAGTAPATAQPATAQPGPPGLAGPEVLLILPAGGQGRAIGGQAAARLLARLRYWTPIAGTADCLLAGPAAPDLAGHLVRPSLDDGLLAAWPGPFGWLVLAEPVSRIQLAALTGDVMLALGLEGRHDHPRAQLKARRLEGRHTELRQAAATGLWRVRLAAGAAAARAAAQVAGLVCASADLEQLPYALTPQPGCAGLAEILDHPAPGGQARVAQARAAQARAAQARPGRIRAIPGRRPRSLVPRRCWPRWPGRPRGRSPGRAVRAAARLRRVTGDHREPGAGERAVPGGPPGALPLGVVLDASRLPAGPLAVPLPSLNRHVFVCGATGAGKSQTVRHLLEPATGRGHPVAGDRAGQGGVPADGRPAAGHRGDPDPARVRRTSPQPGSTRWSPPLARTGPGSRCRPTRTWSAPCSWRRSRPTSRSRRCSPPR